MHLIEHLSRERFAPVCICLESPLGTHYEAWVQALGAPLYFLGKGAGLSGGVLRQLNTLFRRYCPAVVHTHIIGLNYAYPLMLRYRTPARVHTVYNLAHHEIGAGRAWVRKLAFRYCSVATRPAPPQISDHALRQLNLCVPLLGFSTGRGNPLRNRAFRYRIGGVVPVAVVDEVRASIQQLYGYPDPPLIPNGVPTDEYAPDPERRAQWRQAHGLEPHATVLAHVGRFAFPKNHALLVKAFAQTRVDTPLYPLLVGGGELENAVRERVARLNLGAHVRFLGIRTDVANILNASDIFVLSSRWEGNPLSVMEAMAAGLPVVSTAVGGVPELVQDGETGLLVPSEDAGALARALQALVNDAARRQAMGAAARQHAVAHFDIRHTVRQYEALYERLLQR